MSYEFPFNFWCRQYLVVTIVNCRVYCVDVGCIEKTECGLAMLMIVSINYNNNII